MAKTIYGCVNWATGQIVFAGEACDSGDYTGCVNWTGAHAGQVAVAIDEVGCDDTYYGCVNWTGAHAGQVALEIPDNCCAEECVDCAGIAWALGIVYTTDRRVSHNSSSYKCLQIHLSDADSEPGVGNDWETYWELLTSSTTPASITVTFEGISECNDCNSYYNLKWFWYNFNPNQAFVVEQSANPCIWHLQITEKIKKASYFGSNCSGGEDDVWYLDVCIQVTKRSNDIITVEMGSEGNVYCPALPNLFEWSGAESSKCLEITDKSNEITVCDAGHYVFGCVGYGGTVTISE